MKNEVNSIEKEKIEDLIFKYYHEGHALNDGELYRPILHKAWKIFWIDSEGKMGANDKEAYIASYDPAGRDASLVWKTDICYIDVDGQIASAKIRIYNQKFGFTDYFNLMKLEGRWYIVHKISQIMGDKDLINYSVI